MSEVQRMVLLFLDRFSAGAVDSLEPFLAEDLRVIGPYVNVRSRAAYLDALRRDPPTPGTIRVLSVTEEGDSVVVFYEYGKEHDCLVIAQLFQFHGALIGLMRIVFDTGGGTPRSAPTRDRQ